MFPKNTKFSSQFPGHSSHYILILVIAFNEKLLATERKTKHNKKKHINSFLVRLQASLGRCDWNCELLQLHYCFATLECVWRTN